VERSPPRDDPDRKALCCYGLFRADTQAMLLRFVDGRPVSQVTADYLAWVTGTGLLITAPRVEVSGLTVRGFGTGLIASGGSYLALTDVGLTGNASGGGVHNVASFLFSGGVGETFYVRPGLLARQSDNPLAYSGVQAPGEGSLSFEI
jgi:hypothetical protein